MYADAGSQNDPMVIRMGIANLVVNKVLINHGSSVDILSMDVLRKMEIRVASLEHVGTLLIGFGGSKECAKDPYPLPQIKLLVDSTMGFALFSMMNAYQGYHQIIMVVEDRDKTSFIIENSINCYDVMPFGLKNASATYRLVIECSRTSLGRP
ncbi:hypothetical protein Sango_1920000 [Sesamum angolense]|uniref:Uncharacterized protein n=1 Tax=Sesamum angolense TaxID=2727404 RepID=A0AAE1WDS9_9LAMI|nr:hypothetical protein Sango_1920000 [Sesamum angolense]